LSILYLWSRTVAAPERAAAVSLRELADVTGLSKRATQDALGRLQRRKLIGIRRESSTAIPEYTVHRPWRNRQDAE
jgi:DNA-binding transcriptional regulator YhcF (GntR family)